MRSSVDVLIVGAGLSGLTAAREVKRRCPQLKVVVLEAKNRVGGRTHTVNLNGAVGVDQWDLGGQWVGRTQTFVRELLQDLKIETYAQHTEGKKQIQQKKEPITVYGSTKAGFAELRRQYGLLGTIDIAASYSKIAELVKTVNMDDLYSTPNADYFDSISVENWAKQNEYTKATEEILESVADAVFGNTARKMSFLFFLYYCRGAGSLENLCESGDGDGAQRFKVKGGTQQMSERLASFLEKNELFLNAAVINVETKDSEFVTVRVVDTGESKRADLPEKFTCRRLILAIPPTECGRLQWPVGLPLEKRQLFMGMPMGSGFKGIVTYNRAFWRENGHSGEIDSNGFDERKPSVKQPVAATFDACTSTGNAALVVFLFNEWTKVPFEERRTAVVQDLSRFLGAEALDFIDYVDKDWSTELYSGGCVSSLPCGNVVGYSRIRDPIDLVHFAGTETATHWPGYLSGAVQAGLRASHEVLLHLNPSEVDGINSTTQFS